MKSQDTSKIVLDDLSRGLYEVHQKRKNYRINKILRVLMLRSDFIPFLDTLKSKALKKRSVKRYDGKNIQIWDIDFKVCDKLVYEYLNKVEQSSYFSKLSDSWKEHFFRMAHSILWQTHLDAYMNEKNVRSIFNGIIFFDDTVNYPNISFGVYDKELFWKVFTDAFYSVDTRKKYGKSPGDIVCGGSKLEDIPVGMSVIPTNPKVCQIVFDDTTEKQELLDYIDKGWSEIENQLKALRPSRKEKRITTAQNFLRDVDIYNKYQDFKREGFRNPDVKTWTWLRKESVYKTEIDPVSIRKIVSLLKSDIEAINSSNK